MNLEHPSRAFDAVVAALCHGTATEEEMEALHRLLRRDPAARDAYLHRVELHSRLASDSDLFAVPTGTVPGVVEAEGPGVPSRSRRWTWPHALAAGLVFLLIGGLAWPRIGSRGVNGRRAIALLNRTVNARWQGGGPVPRLGAALEPGRLRLQSGLAQLVFYNGARVVIEGPADLQLVSSGEAVCSAGRLTAEVPPQARGFRVRSPRLDVTDLGTSFGMSVGSNRSEVHVFSGRVEFGSAGSPLQRLGEGRGAAVDGASPPRWITADPTAFAALFDLQARSVAADAVRYDQWREANRRWKRDEALWVHLDFEQGNPGVWRLPVAGALGGRVEDVTVVGGQWTEGRWATKPALEFRGVGDRIRLNVPGEAGSVTLAAWVRVQGLDRPINSLFMSDGFAPGTLHWVIRNDGVLGVTVIGPRGGHQILASPPVMTVDQFGIWTHLAVVLDGRTRRVTHFVNGQPVSRHMMRAEGPWRFGMAEIGNWNPVGFPDDDPFHIRNFSGVMDEFLLFARALSEEEIRTLYGDGKPQSDPTVLTRN